MAPTYAGLGFLVDLVDLLVKGGAGGGPPASFHSESASEEGSRLPWFEVA